MSIRLAALLLLSLPNWAAEFQNGQAARLVIGQPSFSAHQPGIAASAIAVASGRLYVNDTAHHLLTYDLGKLPGPNDDFAGAQGDGCRVCGFSPIAIAKETFLGSPAESVFGKTVVLADTANHRVLIWRDASVGGVNHKPDVILGQTVLAQSVLGQPVSDLESITARTLIEPTSIAFDGKRLFVADAAVRRVLVWNSLPELNNQPANAVLGQGDFSSVTDSDRLGPNTIHSPVAIASDGTNLFVADSLDRRILVFTPGDTQLPNNAIVNSASLAAGPLAPGTLITITGTGLAEGNASAPDEGAQPLPTKLGDAEVIFDGTALPLLSVSPTQIHAQLPYHLGNVSAANLYVRTMHIDGAVSSSAAVAIKIVAAKPGLFAFGGTEPRSGLVVHAGSNATGQSGTPVTAENPAKPGEVLIVWAAGLGAVNASAGASPLHADAPRVNGDGQVAIPVGALVNGRSAQVVSATLPQGSVGIYEVRVRLPSELSADPKTQLLITQNEYVSNRITVPVQNAIH